MKLDGKKVLIVGGSIAGCSVAILLQRLGAEVTVLERSSDRVNQGTGIILPVEIVNECIKQDMLDKDIPQCPVSGRSFGRRDPNTDDQQTQFWTQALNAAALNWADIYHNLRKRIPHSNYFSNSEVSQLKREGKSWVVETTSGKQYTADLLIAADGVDSKIRQCILPDAHSEAVGYIAWRGLMNEQDFGEHELFDKNIPYFMFQNGHILIYRIPGPNYKDTKETLLNWVFYETPESDAIDNLFIDKDKQQHVKTLPPGKLCQHHYEHLHALSKRTLPPLIEKLVNETPEPFIQKVFDFRLPSYDDEQLIFLGDAACTLRPHSASGTTKAIVGAFSLFRQLLNASESSLEEQVKIWKTAQQNSLPNDISVAQSMGAALVTHTPDWDEMDQSSTQQWWETVMTGKSWYATASEDEKPDEARSFVFS